MVHRIGTAVGHMLRQRTMRAARRRRQTGNRARRAESGAGHGPAPATTSSRSRGFPRRRAVRRAACVPPRPASVATRG